MSIASEITRLQTAKANLKTQIEAKGVTVDSAATLDSYASYVEEIPTGGGDENKLNALLKNTLTSVTASDLSGVTTIKEGVFSGTTSLVSVDLSNITNVKTNAFDSCSGLTSVSFNTGSTISLGNGSFRSCKGITEVSLNSASLGQFVFEYCTALSSFTATNITGVLSDAVFHGCSSLPEVTTNCTQLNGGATFDGCQSLTSVTFTYPAFKQIGGYSFHNNNFRNCTSLQYIDFTRCVSVPSLSSTDNFSGVPAEMEIRVPQSLYDSWTAATNWSAATIQEHIVAYPDLYNNVTFHLTTNDGYDCDTRMNYGVVSAWTAGFVSREFDAATGGTVVMYGPLTIPNGAYSGKTNLVTFEMSPGVASAGDIVFYNCSNLSSVTLSNTMTTAGRLFMNCYSLTSVVFPDSMTEIVGGMCDNCTALTSVVIGSGVTEIGRYIANTDSIIRDCDNLSSITFRSAVPPTVLRGSIISGGTPATGTLYVPAASVSAYESWIVGTGLANWTVTAISE